MLLTGGRPLGEREGAYAAMKRKEAVHLSKDAFNQFNQTSTQQGRFQPVEFDKHAQDSPAASKPHVGPRSSTAGHASQNGSGSRDGTPNNGEPSLLGCHNNSNLQAFQLIAGQVPTRRA